MTLRHGENGCFSGCSYPQLNWAYTHLPGLLLQVPARIGGGVQVQESPRRSPVQRRSSRAMIVAALVTFLVIPVLARRRQYALAPEEEDPADVYMPS